MSLYQDLIDRVDPIGLTNDTVLFLSDLITWEKILDTHNLSSTGQTDLAAILSYWQGRYDSATEEDKPKILDEFLRRAGTGFVASARRQITEEQLYRILSIDPPGGN